MIYEPPLETTALVQAIMACRFFKIIAKIHFSLGYTRVLGICSNVLRKSPSPDRFTAMLKQFHEYFRDYGR